MNEKMPEDEDWKRELRKVMKESLKPIEQQLSKLRSGSESDEPSRPSSEEKGESDVPIYKCKGKDCGVIFDDPDAFVRHVVKEELASKSPPAEEVPKKRHETVEEYLNCPDCFPKFEKAFLTRGYKKPEEKEPERKGLFE